MAQIRKSGILLHPTSLPSPYGIGDLGEEAFRFIDFLEKSKQTLWQILPLGPVGYAESPYQCFSAHGGNTMLISLQKLVDWGLLEKEETEPVPNFDRLKVEFGRVNEYKVPLYKKAYERFKALENKADFHHFVKDNGFWLDEFSFFMALKDHFGGVAWNQWEKSIAFREPEAILYYREKLSDAIGYHQFLQYQFFTQWLDIKRYANEKGIQIIGDLPIFISYDSSDAWSKPWLFELDEKGYPSKVAGVPPDYFSKTGQYWGNPHYRWDEMEKDGFYWWKERFAVLLKLCDIIRIDHFRGFESYWEIPGSEDTAIKGRWVKAPGKALFHKMEEYFGKLPIIAEDLGIITREVEDLKNEFGFPGMKILQFTFGSAAEERFLPHNYEENSVVYTGTHDNDTTLGWYKSALIEEPEAVESFRRYFDLPQDIDEGEICWKMIEIAFKSPSAYAVIPMQDILCLGTEARMNLPNTIAGNWEWRMEDGDMKEDIERKLYGLSVKYERNVE